MQSNQLQEEGNDQGIISQIMELITGFPLDNSFIVLRELIKIDPSLSLLFKVTGFSSTNTPNIMVSLLE